MILVTGSTGFIGRHLMMALQRNTPELIGVCDRGDGYKEANYWMKEPVEPISAVFHLGAISDTTCDDVVALTETNILLPWKLSDFCASKGIPFIYASSAAVYGNKGKPLNFYAHSKWSLDGVMMRGTHEPPHWYGLRFFNVYGPGEAHKGKQASMVSQMIAGANALFDIEAKRDFIHVDDVVSVMIWLWRNLPASGIYDVGTGVARDFRAIPKALGKTFNEVPMPDSLKGKYQFHTQANLTKLRAAGYDKPFLSLEEGIARMLSM